MPGKCTLAEVDGSLSGKELVADLPQRIIRIKAEAVETSSAVNSISPLQRSETPIPAAQKMSPFDVISAPPPPEKGSLLGLGLIFVGTIVFSAIVFWVKELEAANVPFVQVIYTRYIFIFLIGGAFIQYQRLLGKTMQFFGPKKDRVILVIRAFFYFTFLISLLWAIMFISIGLTTIISYTFPLFTAVISHFGCCSEAEKLSTFSWMCTIIGFVGTFLVVSTEGENSNLVAGVILALVSSISWALNLIFIRRTREDAHWVQIEWVTAFYWVFVFTPLAWIMIYFYNIGINNHEGNRTMVNIYITPFQWFECVCLSFTALFAMGCLTLGFQLETAPRGAIMMYVEIPFVYLVEYFLGMRMTTLEMFGVALVLGGTLGNAVEDYWKIRMRSKKYKIKAWLTQRENEKCFQEEL